MFKILHISWFTKTSYENKTYRWKWRKGRVFHSKIFFSYDMGILESLNTHIIHTLIFWGVFRGHLHVCLALPQIYPRKWKEEISKCSTSTNNCSNGTYDPSLSMFSDTGKSFSIMIYPFLLAPPFLLIPFLLDGPFPLYSEIRRPMHWYIYTSHFPEWHLSHSNVRSCDSCKDIPPFLEKNINIDLTDLLQFVCLGRHSQNQYLWAILLFFIKKLLIPPLLNHHPSLALPHFCEHFLQPPF